MATITPFLWFPGNMAHAVEFYRAVFKDGARLAAQSAMTATLELLGQRLLLLNAHPHHTFNESISLFIECDTQDEVDYYWNALAAGGTEQMCGWLKDRFGLSWQVIPRALGRYLTDSNRDKAERVMQRMLTMRKIVIADLGEAYAS